MSKEKTNKIKDLVNRGEFDVYKDQFNEILDKNDATEVIYALFNYPESTEGMNVLFSDSSLFNSIFESNNAPKIIAVLGHLHPDLVSALLSENNRNFVLLILKSIKDRISWF